MPSKAYTYAKRLRTLLYDGTQWLIATPPSPAPGLPRGEYLLGFDNTTVAGYGVRRVDYIKNGRLSAGGFDISEATINKWADLNNAFAWGRWDVATSPLNEASGLLGAPLVSQTFFVLAREVNPQNRYAHNTFQPESRLFTNPVAGDQMVAEVSDFTSTLGTVRPGYDCAFGYLVSRSGNTSTLTGRHARFAAGWMTNPNTISPAGYGMFLTGYRSFVVAAAISAAGSGYVVGDVVFTASGTAYARNEEAQIKVTAVNGSGAATAIEVFAGGGYTDTFTTTGVATGASLTGSGLTVNLTLSTQAVEIPQAAHAMSGAWNYGIDFCPVHPNLYAKFVQGAIRLPNNSGIVARNAAGNADITLLSLNASDEKVIGGARLLNRAAWAPTISSDSGTFTTVSFTNARWSQSNLTVQAQCTIVCTTKGTAAGALRVSLPATAGAYAFAGSGYNATTGALLTVRGDSGTGYVRVLTAAGGDPLADGQTYVLTFTYEAAA